MQRLETPVLASSRSGRPWRDSATSQRLTVRMPGRFHRPADLTAWAHGRKSASHANRGSGSAPAQRRGRAMPSTQKLNPTEAKSKMQGRAWCTTRGGADGVGGILAVCMPSCRRTVAGTEARKRESSAQNLRSSQPVLNCRDDSLAALDCGWERSRQPCATWLATLSESRDREHQWRRGAPSLKTKVAHTAAGTACPQHAITGLTGLATALEQDAIA